MTGLRPSGFFVLLSLCTSVHADTLSGGVVRVTDGDTIVVLDADNVQHKIRLQGIDASERRQVFGTKSKEHLSDLVVGKTVEVDYSTYDRYGCILGKVMVSGEDADLEQIEAGMAWHFKKYQSERSTSDRIEYSDAELETRRHKIGLWRDPSPVPPWDYRRA